MAIHDEAVGMNKSCIKNLEREGNNFNKKLKVLEDQEIDFSSIEKVNVRILELTEALRISRSDLALVVKEIRQILYTKADDETIIDLEDNILVKLNELAENINKKFAQKAETKIGFKNMTSQIRDLYGVILTLPKDRTKGEEDDAMLSKKPLGGFSCAS